jgi:hypothetical protein
MSLIIHTGIRAYIFQCTYSGSSWIDNPTSLVSDLQSALSGISNFSYNQLKVANVRNASEKKIEIEICGITYQTKTKLSTAEIDDLIADLQTSLMTITNLTFLKIDICSDVFSEQKTVGWPDSSWKRG